MQPDTARRRGSTRTAKRRATPAAAPIELVLPATSANLGAAFDSAALALNLHLRVAARPASGYALVATGRDAGICGRLENNYVLDTYRAAIAEAGGIAPPIALQMENQIPVGKGCGSSAAARLAGLMLAVHFGRLRWPEERIVAAAAQLEGHADNAAACWWGGMAIVKSDRTKTTNALHTATIPIRGDWPLLLVVPDRRLPTEQARAALPSAYPRAHAVMNLQSALFLAVALSQGRAELMRLAFDDRLHEPYRERLCPCLGALRPLAGTAHMLGVVLSGAGPSVLVILEPGSDGTAARAAIRRRLVKARLRAEMIAAAVEPRGARVGFRRGGLA